MAKVAVRHSQIHGKGLFASSAIAAAEVVVRMNPSNFSRKDRHPWNGRNTDTIPHFVNHHCEPNAFVTFLEAEHAVVVVASRFIDVDEEITLDYWLTELGGVRIPCNCPSPICRLEFPTNPASVLV
jgi:hypothetical protein